MTTAIVLSGGGAKGDFEFDALRYLYDQGIRPDIICGTSVGANNESNLLKGRSSRSRFTGVGTRNASKD